MWQRASRVVCGRKIVAILILTGLAFIRTVIGSADMRMIAVERTMLCVTEGTLQVAPQQRLSVNVAKMRAVVNRTTSSTIAAHFTYLGPVAEEAKLASGASRRQFGLKLHAQDACNVVYAMWRFEPESKVVVSVKSNPGQHTSAECGNSGYSNIKALHSSPTPIVHTGDSHWLRAEMNGSRLRISIDSGVVWDGNIGRAAADLHGPVGMRSDNAKLEIELEAGESPGPQPHYMIGCKAAPEPE